MPELRAQKLVDAGNTIVLLSTELYLGNYITFMVAKSGGSVSHGWLNAKTASISATNADFSTLHGLGILENVFVVWTGTGINMLGVQFI